MSCCTRKTRVNLEHPIKYTNFISYPTHCKHLNILAFHNFAEVVFPAIISDSKLQISILECTTNTLVYDINKKPVLATMVEIGRPYSIYFCPIAGGYILDGFTCPTVSETLEAEVKAVIKK